MRKEGQLLGSLLAAGEAIELVNIQLEKCGLLTIGKRLDFTPSCLITAHIAAVALQTPKILVASRSWDLKMMLVL